LDIKLQQRGRASMNFLAAVGGSLARARGRLHEELRDAGISNDTLPTEFPERVRVFDDAVAHTPSYPVYSAAREWMAVSHGPLAIEAFEEVRAEVSPALDRLLAGPTTLEPTLGDDLPSYHRGVAFHRTGSWDGHDYMGVVHGEIVHRRLVARNFGGNIYEQRRRMLDELARPSYPRILEIGVSSGNLTLALAERFADSAITGIDMSLRMLEQAQRLGNEHGYRWRLYQRAAETTGFADASFDLVTGYAVGHEVPEAVMRQILREAHRVLAPGGEMLLGDVVPYAAQDPLTQCWADYDARRGGEPYWREYCQMPLAEVASEVGFERARYEYAAGPRRFPFILHAFKPEASR
jgi:ubiquinone/menaquinone biosynthesis C-methylase UbiE